MHPKLVIGKYKSSKRTIRKHLHHYLKPFKIEDRNSNEKLLHCYHTDKHNIVQWGSKPWIACLLKSMSYLFEQLSSRKLLLYWALYLIILHPVKPWTICFITWELLTGLRAQHTELHITSLSVCYNACSTFFGSIFSKSCDKSKSPFRKSNITT